MKMIILGSLSPDYHAATPMTILPLLQLKFHRFRPCGDSSVLLLIDVDCLLGCSRAGRRHAIDFILPYHCLGSTLFLCARLQDAEEQIYEHLLPYANAGDEGAMPTLSPPAPTRGLMLDDFDDRRRVAGGGLSDEAGQKSAPLYVKFHLSFVHSKPC